MVKNVIFDFGGVLVDWNPHYLYHEFFATEEETKRFLVDSGLKQLNDETDRGVPLIEGIRRLKAEHPDMAELISLWLTRWECMLAGAVRGSEELLNDLHSAGYHLFGLTNWSQETIVFAYRKFGFFQLFEHILVSGSERMAKPDLRFFQLLLDRYGLKAEECIFIDDREENVEAARRLGMSAVRFVSAEQTRMALREQGVGV